LDFGSYKSSNVADWERLEKILSKASMVVWSWVKDRQAKLSDLHNLILIGSSRRVQKILSLHDKKILK